MSVDATNLAQTVTGMRPMVPAKDFEISTSTHRWFPFLLLHIGEVARVITYLFFDRA